MAEVTNTTEKITKKGKPFSYRPEEWVDEACEYIAKKESERMKITLPSKEIKKEIFKEGIKPFFKKLGYPTTEKGWEDLLKEAVAEINE